VDFDLSTEQRDIASAVRDLLTELATDQARRAAIDTPEGYDTALWARLAGELGLAGLIIAEEHGGLGLGALDLALVSQEFGREVVPSPFLATPVYAAALVSNSSDAAAQERWLPRIAAGEAIATVAVQESALDYRGGSPETAATAGADGLVRLNGTKRFVLDAVAADVIFVLAAGADGPALFELDPTVKGVTIEAETSLDPTLRIATVTFTDAIAIPIEGDAVAAVGRALDLLLVAQAAESVGGADRCLEMSVDYAKSRHQFGRPIGSFQAIKHKAADVYIAIELARTAVYQAAWSYDEDPEQAERAIPAAAAEAGRAYALAAGENIQIHGGIGFTWEHSAHWYYKRARSYEVLHGTADEHYRRVLAQVAPA
jgi:alkylation response protein AidB-like acyl-CoA dehydrogenase